MKTKTWMKMTAIGTVAVFAATFVPQTSFAGGRDHYDHHDNTAAAIFAGVAAVGIIAAVASSQHADVSVDYRVGTSVYRPPQHCPPPPPRCEPPQRWIPGHYETVREKVVHPGYWDTVTEPAEYGWVRHGCRWEYKMIKPPCTKRIWVPERCEWIEKQVWVAAHFEPVPKPYAARR
jgi:hypothetical protein